MLGLGPHINHPMWHLRATSHTRLRDRDHRTSSTLIGAKRRSRSRFVAHYAWGTNGVCECKMDVKSTCISTWHQMDHVSWVLGVFMKPTLNGRPNRKPRDQYTLNTHNHWFILRHHVFGPAWIEIHWNSIWLRTHSHMTSYYRRLLATWAWFCLIIK